MPDVVVGDGVLVRLLVQEVEHVLDGQRQSAAPVGRAEDGLKQVVHKLLQRALKPAQRERGGFTLMKQGERGLHSYETRREGASL